MFMIRCILLLLTLTCNLTNNTHQNQLPFLTKNFNQRIKRFWSDKSSKSHSKKEKLLKNNRLFTDELLFTNYEGNQLRNLPKKQYTQQEVAEIQRILSKAEDDYYGILHIKKHATWDEILIAHRKLSLRVHPDKINAPGAKEATQRLNKARAELSKKFRNPNQSTNRLYHVFLRIILLSRYNSVTYPAIWRCGCEYVAEMEPVPVVKNPDRLHLWYGGCASPNFRICDTILSVLYELFIHEFLLKNRFISR
jgi:hypothetical protein